MKELKFSISGILFTPPQTFEKPPSEFDEYNLKLFLPLISSLNIEDPKYVLFIWLGLFIFFFLIKS